MEELKAALTDPETSPLPTFQALLASKRKLHDIHNKHRLREWLLSKTADGTKTTAKREKKRMYVDVAKQVLKSRCKKGRACCSVVVQVGANYGFPRGHCRQKGYTSSSLAYQATRRLSQKCLVFRRDEWCVNLCPPLLSHRLIRFCTHPHTHPCAPDLQEDFKDVSEL